MKKIESSQKDTKSLTLPQSPTAETVMSSPGPGTSHTMPAKPAPYLFASPGTNPGQEVKPSSPFKRVVTRKSQESCHGEGVGEEGGGGGGGEGGGGEAVLRGAGEEVATSDGPGESQLGRQ